MSSREQSLQRPGFVPKPSGDATTAARCFGASVVETEFWTPHICGICCLKMVGDTLGHTTGHTLADLTFRCREMGGFTQRRDGSVVGVFHHPLVELAELFGMRGGVERDLDAARIQQLLQEGKYVLLSVDLHRAHTVREASGSHLVLIFGYSANTDEYDLHDSSAILREHGSGIAIPQSELRAMSNDRGVWLGSYWNAVRTRQRCVPRR